MEGKITGVLYAVFRINENRMKSLKDVKGFHKHMEREKETLNADQDRTKYNRMLIGNKDIYKTMKNRIEGCKLVKNANIGHEIILTASREYFKNINEEQKELWIEANIKFIKEYFGEACIYAMLHMDETTPHIHMVISNKTKDRYGNDTINNSVFFGGKQFEGVKKLRKWQDDYSAAMAQFNLSRGIRFSKATHVQVRQFYSLINDNMSIEKLNSVIDSAYRYNFIKEQFQAVADELEPSSGIDVKQLRREIYKLSTLVTAPEKFYSEEKEKAQRLVLNNLLSSYDNVIIDKIAAITREAHTTRKETSAEAYARIVAETRIKREVLELKKLIKTMNSEGEVREKDREKLETRLKSMKEDEQIFKTVIRTLSEYYYIPQQAVERIIRQAREENREAGPERTTAILKR